MSAAAPVLRRSTRNTAKRESPAVTTEGVAPVAKKKRTTEKKAAAPKKAAAAPTVPTPPAAPAARLKDGDALPDDLPEIQTHTGETTTLSALVEASEKGLIIFAYPKASTPGCTTQACAFRDSTAVFKDAGYAIFGLSGDSPAANEKFKTKQNLADITMLCDPKYELHERLAIKKGTKGTIRSVLVIGKKDDGAMILRKSAATPANSVNIALEAINISDAKVPEDKEG